MIFGYLSDQKVNLNLFRVLTLNCVQVEVSVLLSLLGGRVTLRFFVFRGRFGLLLLLFL